MAICGDVDVSFNSIKKYLILLSSMLTRYPVDSNHISYCDVHIHSSNVYSNTSVSTSSGIENCCILSEHVRKLENDP